MEDWKKEKYFFVSSNPFKLNQVERLCEKKKISVTCVEYKIDEIQCLDMKKIVSDKVKKAYCNLKRNVFVEQTGLYIDDFGGLPGGLTETIWNALEPEKFCDYFGKRENSNAKIVVVIGYCDGKTIHMFDEVQEGTIALEPSGSLQYQWDTVFIPKGETRSEACLRVESEERSIRYRAMSDFLDYLQGENDEGTN